MKRVEDISVADRVGLDRRRLVQCSCRDDTRARLTSRSLVINALLLYTCYATQDISDLAMPGITTSNQLSKWKIYRIQWTNLHCKTEPTCALHNLQFVPQLRDRVWHHADGCACDSIYGFGGAVSLEDAAGAFFSIGDVQKVLLSAGGLRTNGFEAVEAFIRGTGGDVSDDFAEKLCTPPQMASRETGFGAVEAYMHQGKLLALDLVVRLLENPLQVEMLWKSNGWPFHLCNCKQMCPLPCH